MKTVRLNIHEAKTHLSRYLEEMRGDDRIIICNRNRPVAELRLLSNAQKTVKRKLGVAKGEFQVPDSFQLPLPAEILDEFEGCH